MRPPIVAGRAFVAGCRGAVLGAAIAANPERFGFSLTLPASATEADGRRPPPEAAKRDPDGARRRASEKARILDTNRAADGVVGRRFRQTATVNGTTVSGVGTACYKNAVWQIAA